MASRHKCTGCKKFFPAEQMIVTPAGKFHDKDCMISYATSSKDKLVSKGNAMRTHEERKANAAKKREEKAERARLRERKEELKPRSKWLAEAQKWFNKFIRLRDAHLPCISCGRHHEGQYHAGHYRTTKAASQLRFNEDNCHKQCAPCNNHLSGNIENYRPALIEKIGIDRVEALESNNETHRYTVDDLKEIISTYKLKCKEYNND